LYRLVISHDDGGVMRTNAERTTGLWQSVSAVFVWAISGLLLVALASCGDSSGSYDADAGDGGSTVAANEGLAGGPCFPNGTCFEGLDCVAGTCLDPNASSGISGTWLMIDGLPVGWSTSTVVLTTTDANGGSQSEETLVRGLTIVELPVVTTSTVQAFAADPGAAATGAGYYATADDVEPGQTRRITGWSYRDAAGAAGTVGGMPLEESESMATMVSGLVTLNGEPAAGALVVSSQYCGNTQCAGFSDEQGLFSFLTVPGIQRVEASLNSFASVFIEVNVAGSDTDSGELALMESDVLVRPLLLQAVDGTTGAVILNVEARDVTGLPAGEVDEDGTLEVPSVADVFYLRAPGYAVSPVLYSRRLLQAAAIEGSLVRIELHAYAESCTRLAGDWSSTGWQSLEVWFGLEGDDPETDWTAVPESEQMRVFLDPDDVGWADVDLGAPFVDGADGYWLRCAPRGASMDEISVSFHPLNFLQQGQGVPSRFPAVGETPGAPLFIAAGTYAIPHFKRAQMVADEYWYGFGDAYLGRWLYGTLSQGSPPECDGVPDEHVGDYLIGGSGIEDELSGLACLRRIEGSLQFGPASFDASEISAPLLESVGGDLRIFNSLNVTQFSFDALRSVGGTIRVEESQTIERISWPRLQEAGAVSVLRNRALRAVEFPMLRTVPEAIYVAGVDIESLSLPALTDVGALVVDLTSIVSLRLPALQTAGMDSDEYAGIALERNNALTTIEFEVLETVSGSLSIDVTGEAAIAEFPVLRSIGKDLYLSRANFGAAPGFESLASIGGRLGFWAQSREESFAPALDFPLLTEVGDDIQISAIERLRTLNFPLLQRVGGVLWIDHHPELNELELPELQEVGSLEVGRWNALAVHDNASLRLIAFPSLVRTEGLNVQENPGLTSLSAGALSRCGPVAITYNGQLCVSQAASIYERCGRELPELHWNLDGC
jgi:hypothetical protein